MGCSARLLSLTPIALIVACQQSAEITVSQTPAAVVFAIDHEGGEKCVDSVSVYPSTPDDAQPVWLSNRGSRGAECVTRVVYGEPPTGFGRQNAAAPLMRGGSYRVMVSGPGFIGAADFIRD